MLRLLTFGGLTLEAEGAVPASRLRRPWLAMLAVIAASGDRGVPRERLIALFWPDSDEERARHSARQVLYGLRQELGRDVVRSAGTTLSLDAAAITSDVGDFRAALAAGNRALAVSLARGPFLDSFYLPGASAFERWLEEERNRLTSAQMSALQALATEASREKDSEAAVEWWRQLTVLDPLSGRFAVGFLKALAARGDRAEALAFAKQHELVIRRELEAEPDLDVRRIEAELRAMPSAPMPVTTIAPAAGASWSPPMVAMAPLDSAPTPDAPGAQPHRTPRKMVALAGAAAMLLIVVTAAFARQLGWLRPAASASPTFAVGLIREDDVPDSLRQGRVLTDMMATNLARVEGLRVLANSRLLEVMQPGSDSAAGYSVAARRAGATELLEGQLLREADARLTLEIRRVELQTGLVKDVYRVSASNRYALVDSVTRLISSRMRLPSPTSSIADATTTSLVAYRLYEEGLRAYHEGDMPSAQRLMRAAVAEDSTFAMAVWYEAYLNGATVVMPDGRTIRALRQRALQLAQRAPDRERLLISASVLAENNDPGAVLLADSLTTRFPDDPRALMLLARIRMAAGDWRRAASSIERAIALDSIAETDGTSICRVCDDFHQLSDLYSWWDSLPAAQRTARRFMALRPKHAGMHGHLAGAAARMGDSATAYSAYRRLISAGPAAPDLKLALDLSLESYDAVEREVRRFLGSPSANDWGNSAFAYFIVLRAQGRLREAAAFNRDGWIPGLPPLLVERKPSERFDAILALETGDSRGAAGLFRRLMSSHDGPEWTPNQAARNRAWTGTLTGMALAEAGDTAAVRAMVDSVEQWGLASAFGRDRKLHHYLRGMLEMAAGRDEEAVRRFRAAIYSPSLGFTRVNYELGRALLRLDRPREAIEALQPSLRGVSDASNLYISRTDLHELLAESFDRAGVRDSAAFHYRAVLKAWRRADPQFHSRRDRAAAWLARNSPVTISGSLTQR